MLQKKYLCRDIAEAEKAIGQISELLSKTPHRSAVLTIYEAGFSADQIEPLVERIKGCHPDLKIAGISIMMIAELMPEGTGILLNLITADEADIEVIAAHCKPGGEAEAAAVFRERLNDMEDVRAVELFASNMQLNTTRFMEKAMEGHEDVVLFGTATTRGLAAKMSVEEGENVVEIEQEDSGAGCNEFIVADSVMFDGFAAVVFAGKNLKVLADYALGWNPIGRHFSVELGEHAVKGETVVRKINGRPAVDIYREYLGVYPDSYLISNVCEFPLVVEREGINICLIPIDCGRDGELYFMMTIRPDDTLRFTFASHDEVLSASRVSLDEMEEFGPEALFLTLCGNRINFLKEDAHIEWDEFSQVSPEHAVMHGACELLYHNGKGGILNSAHLTIGMKESDAAPAEAEYVHPTVEGLRHGRVLSLSDRMSVFLSKMTTELIDIAAEAREANNAKSAFLSHMSHEIRTPINAILGMNEMILRESSEEGTLDYADGIRSAGSNLLGIVNDILDFSKIEAGKMSIIPVEYDLARSIRDMHNIVRVRAADKGLTVKLDIEPSLPSVLFGDETRIKQAITNLLTNAVKYTERGAVTLSVRQIAATDKDEEELARSCPGESLPADPIRVEVSVKDTGIGIRPEDMDKLFEEYERFDEKRNRKIEGTGLGLSITRQLLELMGSHLKVESTYGEGSVFGFEIMQGVADPKPVGESKSWIMKKAIRRQRVSFTAEDARILIVDDSSVNLKVAQSLLKKTKIKIDAVQSGKEALELVRRHEYDVIFLDHLMPEMDGPQTLAKMNEMEGNLSAGKPVISLTSNVAQGLREEYIKQGYRDYLSKPIHPEDLEAMLFYYIPPEKIRTVQEDAEGEQG